MSPTARSSASALAMGKNINPGLNLTFGVCSQRRRSMFNMVRPSLNILAGMGLRRVNLVREPTPEYAIGKKDSG